MKTCFLALAVVSVLGGQPAPPLISDTDARVIRVVLESQIPALLESLDDTADKTVMISDVTTKCQLPIGEDERERQKRAYDRIEPRLKRGESVDLAAFWPNSSRLAPSLLWRPARPFPEKW